MEFRLPFSEIQSSFSAPKYLSEMRSVIIILRHSWKMSIVFLCRPRIISDIFIYDMCR